MERLVRKTGVVDFNFHWIEGDAADPAAVAREVGQQLASAPIDIAFVGIGENGHIAFNDPPADFVTEDPYIIVNLNQPCRQQQVGESWFADISQVPKRAISMSPRQILKATEIVAVVPDKRKAAAVRACLEGEISPMAPASILRTHPNATVYLDVESAVIAESGAAERAGGEVAGDGEFLATQTVRHKQSTEMASARKPIPSLRWWIGGLLFASTVINYIDRQTFSLLAPYLKTRISLDEFRLCEYRHRVPGGVFHRPDRFRQAHGSHWHAARPDADGDLVFGDLHADVAGGGFLQLRNISVFAGHWRIGQLARGHQGGVGMVSETRARVGHGAV